MKLNLYKLLPFVIILLFLSLAQNILACQCRGFDTPYESYKKADAVFLGKVIGITDESGKAIIKNTELSEGNNYREREGTTEYNQIAVQEWFKGEQKAEVRVSTSINMCEHGFTPNETYLVYAYKSGAILETYLFCSRTYFLISLSQEFMVRLV
jgi:hypothetical protein